MDVIDQKLFLGNFLTIGGTSMDEHSRKGELAGWRAGRRMDSGVLSAPQVSM